MRKAHVVLLAFLVVLTLATACKPKTDLQQSATGQTTAAANATQQPFQLTLTTDPQKPQVDKPFTMRVHVSNEASAAISDATLTGELTMKIMDHGKTRLDFDSKGNGDYEVMAKAVMSGPWLVKLTAKSGTVTAEKVVEVEVGD